MNEHSSKMMKNSIINYFVKYLYESKNLKKEEKRKRKKETTNIKYS